jgi:hypothetical protein
LEPDRRILSSRVGNRRLTEIDRNEVLRLDSQIDQQPAAASDAAAYIENSKLPDWVRN